MRVQTTAQLDYINQGKYFQGTEKMLDLTRAQGLARDLQTLDDDVDTLKSNDEEVKNQLAEIMIQLKSNFEQTVVAEEFSRITKEDQEYLDTLTKRKLDPDMEKKRDLIRNRMKEMSEKMEDVETVVNDRIKRKKKREEKK